MMTVQINASDLAKINDLLGEVKAAPNRVMKRAIDRTMGKSFRLLLEQPEHRQWQPEVRVEVEERGLARLAWRSLQALQAAWRGGWRRASAPSTALMTAARSYWGGWTRPPPPPTSKASSGT